MGTRVEIKPEAELVPELLTRYVSHRFLARGARGMVRSPGTGQIGACTFTPSGRPELPKPAVGLAREEIATTLGAIASYSLLGVVGSVLRTGPIQIVWIFTNSRIPNTESSRP